MQQPIQILIVEDNLIIGAKISLYVSELGYEVPAIIPKAEDALRFVEDNPPDILLLDIQLKGEMDGISLARHLMERHPVPIIYLTANTDEASFNKAKQTRPYAFISKPFKKRDLQRAIELTLSRMQHDAETQEPPGQTETPEESSFILSDRLFVRHKEKMIKLYIREILYIEADRNYSRLITADKEYLLTKTLKQLEDKLPQKHFLRIHRSYIVNLSQIDELADGHLIIHQKLIPFSKNLKAEIWKRVKTI